MRIAVKSVMVAVLLVAGCATPPQSTVPQPQVTPPKVNLSGFSPAFKRGYADGCESARSLLSRKDERSFRGDADYVAGWNDGHSICRRRGE